MLFKKYLFLFFISFTSIACFSQQQNEQENYNSELIAGINLNTNANIIGGLIVSYYRRISPKQFHYFGLEIVNVKHPKEVRVGSSSTGNLYIFMKKNHFIPLRLQYGRQYVLFHPAEEEGVQVGFNFAGGPSIGILKPYMVEYNYGSYSQVEPFNPDKQKEILGAAGIFSGFGMAKILPGINLKTSFSFKFSQFLGSVTGIEVGSLIELYPKEVIIIQIPSTYQPPQNFKAFSSIFINVFFGMRR